MRRPSLSGSAVAVLLVAALFVPGSALPASANEISASPRWENLDPRVRPSGVSAPEMAFDEARGELVLFGFGTWIRRDGTWQHAQPEVQPPLRHGAVMAYDAARAETILFGGYVGMTPTNETWIWDGVSWRSETPEIVPTRRAYASIAYDRTSQRVVMFGGITKEDSGAFRLLDDTWAWDGTGWTWTELQPDNRPPGRNGAGMTYDDARGEIVLFGGSGQGTPRECITVAGSCFITTSPGSSGGLGDTWTFDGNDWVEKAPDHAPPARSDMAMAYDPGRQEVVLFAGVSISALYNDTWTWDGSVWQEHDPSEPPERRFSPAAATNRVTNEVVVFGGHRITYLGRDTWAWDGQGWTSLEIPTPKPRFAPVMTPDPGTGGALLFGGQADERFGDTWVFDEGSWTRLAPATSPPARADASIAYDAERERALLFGGFGNETRDLSDSWVWDGQTWSDVTPALPRLSPPARRSAAMAYDPDRDEAVLFGGWNPRIGVFGDTWTWDGSTWTLETPLQSPPPMRDAVMAFDAARGEVVMFGGLNDTNDLVDQTWVWNGATWSHRQPPVAPRPRSGAMMSYDLALEKVVLFSGLSSGAPDVWTWDGTEWTELVVAEGPRRRAWGGFTATEQGLLLFGGNGSGYLDDTWLLRTVFVALETAVSLSIDGHGIHRLLAARLHLAGDPTSVVPGRPINFYADGEAIGSAITDGEGVARLQPPPRYRGGKHDFEARFEGDDDHLASSDEQST